MPISGSEGAGGGIKLGEPEIIKLNPLNLILTNTQLKRTKFSAPK